MENNILKVDGNVNLTSNYDELKTKLKNTIDSKYNIVVTNDNIKDSKSMMAQINKDKNACKESWIEIKKGLEAPIKELDLKVKELLSLYDDARSVISVKVNNFEDEKRTLANNLCIQYCNTILDIKKIDIPNEYPHWGNLTYITEANKLSSVGKKAVEDFVNKLELELLRLKEDKLLKEVEQQKIKKEAITELYVQTCTTKEQLKQVNENINDEVSSNTKLVIITLKFISKNDNETIKNNILSELSDKFKKCINDINIKDI